MWGNACAPDWHAEELHKALHNVGSKQQFNVPNTRFQRAIRGRERPEAAERDGPNPCFDTQAVRSSR